MNVLLMDIINSQGGHMNTLNIDKRDLSRKPRVLREHGIVPGTLFGPEINSEPIELSLKELKKMNQKSGEIYQVNSKNGSILVKFDEIQKDPVSKEFIHFSLMQLPKGVENELDIPLEFTGKPKGLKKGGVLVILREELSLIGKPKSFPKSIKVNVSSLDIGDKLTLGMIDLPKKLDIELDTDEVIAVCRPPAKETDLESESETEPELISDQKVTTPLAK